MPDTNVFGTVTRNWIGRQQTGDDGKVWTRVSAVVEQVRIRSERHKVNIAAWNKHSQHKEVTPEFLAHLAFNHRWDNAMKLMRKHSELYDLKLGSPGPAVGQTKHCTGCLVANRRLGALAA